MIHALLHGAAFRATVLVIAGSGQTAPSQEAGVGGLHLTDIGGYFEFVLRQKEDEQKSKVGAGNTRSEETIFQENFKLELDGYVYHPNFLEFTLGGLYGLRQHDFEDQFDGRRRTSGDDGDVIEFDFTGNFFKHKPYPGTIFARRYQAIDPRPFQSSLLTTTTDYGFTWQYVSEKMPTNVQFSQTEIELDPLGDEEETGRYENTRFRLETAYNFTENNALSFLYTRESRSEEPFVIEWDADEFTLGHRLNFGEAHRQRLDSEINYYDQRGTFEIERFRWRELLRLEHTDSLRSWYQFEALDRTQGSLQGVPPIQEDTFTLSGTVEHELYESLVSQLTGYVQSQEFDMGPQIDRYGVQASFDYRKTNPWGVFHANYAPRFLREDRSGGERDFEVFRQAQTFRDPDPIVLTNLNIEISSIQVTSEDTLTVYQPGRDYRVEEFEDRVELHRVPTGRILDGQTVLVSYVFSSGSNYTLDTVGQDFGVRQEFDFGLSPYYRLRWQEQEISPEDATGAIPDDITAHIIGAEFERWGFRVGAEYEDHDSTVSPFEATRLFGEYTYRFESGPTASVKARWTDATYTLPRERDTEFFWLEGRYRHPITERLTVEASARYRTLEDSLSGDDEGVDFDLSLEWFIRQTEVRITYEQGSFEDNFSESDNSSLYVQVKRRF